MNGNCYSLQNHVISRQDKKTLLATKWSKHISQSIKKTSGIFSFAAVNEMFTRLTVNI